MYHKEQIYSTSVICNTNLYYAIRKENFRRKEVIKLKESIYKTYDELPLFLNADTVAKVLGIAVSTAYELMHEKDFPALKIGNRLVVPKDRFVQWVKIKTNNV